ncbi:MAG TPA: proton-conducting transporter membrane subunit, partial [Burkholderiaceae bacterium]|nr:proton-conducting transporter membrane subunit [Burkholderiaceae bacterium]
LGRDRRALLAAYQYLIVGTIGATFFVIGVGLLYLMTGTLNLADMAGRLTQLGGTRPVLSALAFITVGLSLKAALFPLHQWLPNAYTYAPSAVSAFLSATATKVALYALLRFYISVFGDQTVFDHLPMGTLMLLLALAAMFVASTVACFQTDLKRLFAYSSVAQIGYIVLGLSFDSVTGLTATIVHLLNHGLAKGALFMLLGAAALKLGGTQLERVQGMGRTMPVTSLCVVVCGLSLIGVPGTAGFITKWYLIMAALDLGQWWLVFLIVGSSMLAFVYTWRFVEAAYLHAPRVGADGTHEAPVRMLLPAVVLVLAVVYFGLDTRWSIGGAHAAASALLGVQW